MTLKPGTSSTSVPSGSSYSMYASGKCSTHWLQGVQLTCSENTPAIQNSTPPSKNSGHGPVKTMTLKPGTSSTSVPSGSSYSMYASGKCSTHWFNILVKICTGFGVRCLFDWSLTCSVKELIPQDFFIIVQKLSWFFFAFCYILWNMPSPHNFL